MFNISTILIAFVIGGRGLAAPPVIEELGLNDAQVQKIQQIHTKYQEQRIDLRSQIAKKRLQLRTLWMDKNPDMNKIEKLVNEIGDLRTQMMLIGARERNEIRNVLTDEQFEKWQKIRWTMRRPARPDGMRGRGAPPGDMHRRAPRRW